MVLVALIAVEVVHDIAVIVIDHKLGLVILICRHDLHAAIAQELIDGGQLCIGNVDIFEDDLNLILGDGPRLRPEIEKLLNGRIQRRSRALSLFRHRCSLLNT